jgi:hypothetical protein
MITPAPDMWSSSVVMITLRSAGAGRPLVLPQQQRQNASTVVGTTAKRINRRCDRVHEPRPSQLGMAGILIVR